MLVYSFLFVLQYLIFWIRKQILPTIKDTIHHPKIIVAREVKTISIFWLDSKNWFFNSTKESNLKISFRRTFNTMKTRINRLVFLSITEKIGGAIISSFFLFHTISP